MPKRDFPSYTTKIKIAVDHGGRCTFCGPNSQKLYPNLKGEELGDIKIGKFAHIHSETKNGPRFDKKISREELGSRLNFLYVCEEHHNLIDENEENYSPKMLKEKRAEHVKQVEVIHDKKRQKNAIIILEDSHFGRINRSTILDTIETNSIPVVDLNIFVKIPKDNDNFSWKKKCKIIKKNWIKFQNNLLRNNINFDKYYVYSITKIPFAIFFGALLQETNIYELHQWRRKTEERTWVWNTEAKDSSIDLLPPEKIKEKDPVILKVEFSKSIDNQLIEQLNLPLSNLYSFRVDEPNRYWLQSTTQLADFCNQYRILIERLNQIHKNSEIHLFFAGPIPYAIFIGQIFNPRMDLPLIVYNRQKGKNGYYYKRIFELGDILTTTGKIRI